MQQLGVVLAGSLNRGSIVTLSGELGAGKSVLARAILHALGYPGRVKSPTYTLMETYMIDAPGGSIRSVAHLDLYRLADAEELHYLGFDDVIASFDLILIEWPEMAKSALQKVDVSISMNIIEEPKDKPWPDNCSPRDVQILSDQYLALS